MLHRNLEYGRLLLCFDPRKREDAAIKAAQRERDPGALTGDVVSGQKQACLMKCVGGECLWNEMCIWRLSLHGENTASM